MDAELNFNIWLITSVTDEDKEWLNSNDYVYRIEQTGLLQYYGEECLVVRPLEKYLGFMLLKFCSRMKPFPLEQYMMSDIIALYKL